jgi:integrase/recombinase XerD
MSERHSIGVHVRRFLLEHVVADRCLSPNTRKSYRDSLRLLIDFVARRHSRDVTRLSVEDFDVDAVRAFLEHLVKDRGNAATTRNLRLAAIHTFFRFVARQVPELIDLAEQVRGLPLRRTSTQPMPYLEKAELDALLAAPDRRRPQGERDYALLLFLYNTGARASEAATATIGSLDLGTYPSVRLLGKGGKTRLCPLWPHTAQTLRRLLGSRLDGPDEALAFLNVRGAPVTRFGIHTLVRRTALKAAPSAPSLRDKRVSPHTIRHTAAVHLLRAGVDINTIRAWLGHVSLETTNRYAEVDFEAKTRALAATAVTSGKRRKHRAPAWRASDDLRAFLASL